MFVEQPYFILFPAVTCLKKRQYKVEPELSRLNFAIEATIETIHRMPSKSHPIQRQNVQRHNTYILFHLLNITPELFPC